MNKFFLSIIVALGTALSINAQSNAQDEMIFNHYIINPVIINPAATGVNGGQNFYLHYNSNWTGFTGAPATFAANYHGSVGQKLGLGALVSNDKVVNQNRLRALLSYSFRFNMNGFKGALGLSTEFKRLSLDANAINNPLVKGGDDVIDMNMSGVSYFDATAGFYGTYQDKLTVGLSMPNLIQARLSDINAAGGENSQGGFKYYTFMLGYKETINAITVEPSLVMKRIPNAPFQVDLNMKASFLDERIIGGISYRAGAGGAVGVLVGTKYNGMTFAYSYGYGLSPFQAYSGGSHELTVGYTIFKKTKSAEDMLIERSGGNYSN
jgi:type IX secretion system PorP/SprF family membrane protein